MSRVICLTHTPGDWCQVGAIYVDREGTLWRINKLRSLTPTRHLDGSFAPCWEVRGRKVRQTK